MCLTNDDQLHFHRRTLPLLLPARMPTPQVPPTQITVFDSIDTEGRYSTRVRYLRQFQPDSPEGMTEIEDPLYGSPGLACGGSRMRAGCPVHVWWRRRASMHHTRRRQLWHQCHLIEFGPCVPQLPSPPPLPTLRSTGNTGGAGEAAAMSAAASLIVPSCQGLAAFLADLNAGCEDGAALKARLAETVDGMQGIDWLVPPLLRAGT